jgi:hypothetical protein
MTTKAPEPSKASKPHLELFLADDVRMELGDKVTAVGLYTDRVVVALIGPDQAGPSREAPLLLNGLSFLVSIRGLVGRHSVRVKYEDPPVVQVAPPARELVFQSPAESANLVGRFQPFVTTAFGTKSLVVEIDGTDYPLEFEVREGRQATADNTGPAASGQRVRLTAKKAAARARK